MRITIIASIAIENISTHLQHPRATVRLFLRPAVSLSSRGPPEQRQLMRGEPGAFGARVQGAGAGGLFNSQGRGRGRAGADARAREGGVACRSAGGGGGAGANRRRFHSD